MHQRYVRSDPTAHAGVAHRGLLGRAPIHRLLHATQEPPPLQRGRFLRSFRPGLRPQRQVHGQQRVASPTEGRLTYPSRIDCPAWTFTLVMAAMFPRA